MGQKVKLIEKSSHVTLEWQLSASGGPPTKTTQTHPWKQLTESLAVHQEKIGTFGTLVASVRFRSTAKTRAVVSNQLSREETCHENCR